MEKHKVIIDTDLGSDVDDAFALLYMKNHPAVELLGITTVSGEASVRAQLCNLLLDDPSCPISIGKSEALDSETCQPFCQQGKILDRFNSSRSSVTDVHAVEFMRQKIDENPGEVNVIAIGPLTNIALLFQMYPWTIEKIKALYLMGFKIDNSPEAMDKLDWNLLCDSFSAKQVLQSKLKRLVVIPCDTTYQLSTSFSYFDEKCQCKEKQVLTAMLEVWLEKYEAFSYHDPLLCVALTRPDLFESVQGRFTYNPHGNPMLSMTTWEKDADGNCECIMAFNQAVFLEELYGVINSSR